MLVSLTLQKKKMYQKILEYMVQEEAYEQAANVRDVINTIDPREIVVLEDLWVKDVKEEDEEDD
jgi:protein-arginine kinase activator protein McsA